MGAGVLSGRESGNLVMLLRNRLSRIYYGGEFFDYPLKPSVGMLRKLGLGRSAQFGLSYAAAMARPISPEKSLEDFFINRFGSRLYRQFFKEYTEKVWGVPCNQISADWGAQRIKSLSVGKALIHGLKQGVWRHQAVEQTSLIERFLYPKYGPGQMWEEVARKFQAMGGRLILGAKVHIIERNENIISTVKAFKEGGGQMEFDARHVVSTMPIKDLMEALRPAPAAEVRGVAGGLQYRDFITVGLLYKRIKNNAGTKNYISLPDNWIYIQEPGVKVGRLQIFNNWSPYMVADPETVWVGLEFFAREDDELWGMGDEDLKSLAVREMSFLGLASERDVLDATVIRVPKAYPGYFGGAYKRFNVVKDFLDSIQNIYLIGRNGMHRYNNQDHSMLSAKYAVESILRGDFEKSKIWSVNIGDDYHEEVYKGRESSSSSDEGLSPAKN